jgi:CRISPR-associated protein Csm4
LEEDQGAGNLYNTDELMFVDTEGGGRSGLSISLYVKVADQTWADEAKRLLDALAAGGYGAKKSAGYGHFVIEAWGPFDGFQPIPENDANGFISLSNWVPAASDPTEGYYATLVKYGKLGESLAASENPFKFPLVMLTAGSAFFSDGPPREWYGRLVSGVAPGHPHVVQYGLAFVLPANLGETRNV